MPENGGFEMFRDSSGMWHKSQKIRIRRVLIDRLGSHNRSCPKCGRKVFILYKTREGEIVCSKDLGWPDGSRSAFERSHRDGVSRYTGPVPIEQEAA